MGHTAGKLYDKCILLGICSCLMCGITVIMVKGDLGHGESRAVCRIWAL